MAEGKITLYGELESGVPGGFIVDAALVKNFYENTLKQIEDINAASGNITIRADRYYRIYQSGDISFYVERVGDSRLHTLELSLITGETTFAVSFTVSPFLK